MPYRVLHFIDTLGAGGAERQLVYLLENLAPARYESHVLTTYDTFRHYEAELRSLNIPLYSLHHGDLYPTNRARAFSRYVHLMWQLRPQLVHGWLHYPNLIARLARPLCPPHRLVTAVRSEYSRRQWCIEQVTESLSDFRVVINTKQQTKNTHIPTITIPNAIDTNLFLAKHTQTHPYKTSFTLLMVARIDPRKDHQTLLNALHQLHQTLPNRFKTILLGEITDLATQQQLEKTIEKYNLNELIEQLPPTNNMASHYHLADVTVLPSRTEASANVILESFAAGKPIISSTAANSNALVEHKTTGWIFPTGNSNALAECIKIAWQTPQEERILMGKRGQEIARFYSVAKMVKQYEQLYERALSDP